MRIQTIHGGELYIRLGEKHGRTTSPKEITVWADTPDNMIAARRLEDQEFIRVLDELPPKLSLDKSELKATRYDDDWTVEEVQAAVEFIARRRLGDKAPKELEASQLEANTKPAEKVDKAPGFNFGCVAPSNKPPESGFNFGAVSSGSGR